VEKSNCESVAQTFLRARQATGSAEVYELRDGDEALYGGMGVLRTVENVNGEIVRHCSTVEEAFIRI